MPMSEVWTTGHPASMQLADSGGYETMIVAVMEIEYEDLQDVPVSERSE